MYDKTTFCFYTIQDLLTNQQDGSKINIVGKIVYTSEYIYLETTCGNKRVVVDFVTPTVPENGMHVHIFGLWICYAPGGCTQEGQFVQVSMWNDMGNNLKAQSLEDVLQKINKIEYGF